MWEFLGILIDQLGETFRWFLTGFFFTVVLLILLYKNNLISNNNPFGFIKKISYYIFFPLYIGIICWFTSATLLVEKDAKELAKITLQKAENSLFPQFSKYILSLTDDWLDGSINSKEELVQNYLEKNDYKEGSLSTTAMEWTLNNGLKYIENQAIKNGTLKIGEENINFPKLISNYLSGDNGLAKMPFNYLKGMSLQSIHNYAKSFYLVYLLMALVVFFILGLDIYFHLKKRKNNQESILINPSTTLENNQPKLENSTKELDGTRKLN